jgi:hypothetical protein
MKQCNNKTEEKQMKNHKSILLIFLVLISTSVTKLFAQDPITEYDGIPLIIYPDTREAPDFQYPINYQQMDTMGVYGVVASEILDEPEYYLEYFEEYNLKAIPWEKRDTLYNHIYKYTDAHYTVWEAEGTDPSKGKVTLYHSEHTNISPDGKSVKAEGPNVPDGETIILGPGYPQNGTYRLNDEFVHYFAEYWMKIDTISTPPPGYLNDVVCTIMVTNINEAFTKEDTVIFKEVKVSNFNGWNDWKGIQVSDNPSGYTLQGHTFDFLQTPGGTESYQRASCIQFKIIWAGLDYVNLYIDKIRLYDDKGLELVEEPEPASLITGLVNTYINDPTIIGWYGTDEPQSIDNYEPFRVVDSIINAKSNGNLRLHAGFTGGYPGTYTTWVVRDTFALNNFQDVEFWFRAKPKNLQMNLYNYHYPWKSCCPGIEGYNEEWQTENILYVTNTLSRINKLDTSFAYSTQAGSFGPGVPGESIIPTTS